MISFVTKMTKTDPQSPGKEAEDNRFEQIRKSAAERRSKRSPTNEARVAAARQMANNNRLL